MNTLNNHYQSIIHNRKQRKYYPSTLSCSRPFSSVLGVTCVSLWTPSKKKIAPFFYFLASAILSPVQCPVSSVELNAESTLSPSLPLWNCSSEPLSFLTSPTFLAKFNFSFFVCLCFNCFCVCVSSTNSVCVLIVSLCAWVLPTVFFSGLLELWQVCSCKESVRCASFPKTTQPTSPPTSPPSPASPSSLRHQCGHHHRNPKKSWSTYNDLTLCVQLDHD